MEILDENAQAKDPSINKDVVQMNIEEAASNVRKMAYWFYWIAGLSFVNTFLAAKGTIFIMGLAISQLIDGVVLELTGDVNYFISFLAPALFIGLGFFSSKLNRWAFIVGAILYLFDGLIYLYFEQWLAAGFHTFVLYKLFQGYKAISEFEEESEKIKSAI